VGKTWRLAELRAPSVISVCVLATFLHQSLVFMPALIALGFDITLSRTYRWQTEDREEAIFLDNLVRLFRSVTSGQVSLHLDGVQDYDIFARDNFFGYLVNPTTDLPTQPLRDIPMTLLDVVANRGCHNACISYFDSSNQARIDLLIVDAQNQSLMARVKKRMHKQH
jgi:hypothetical protein